MGEHRVLHRRDAAVLLAVRAARPALLCAGVHGPQGRGRAARRRQAALGVVLHRPRLSAHDRRGRRTRRAVRHQAKLAQPQAQQHSQQHRFNSVILTGN